MKILTWNLGLSWWCKYAHYFGLEIKGEKIKHEYFQKQHLETIVAKIEEINPTICILQEFYDEKDRLLMISKLGKKYPYNSSLHAWYHQHTIMVFSLDKIKVEQLSETGFYVVKTDSFSLVPIHLHSFSAEKRLKQIKNLLFEIEKSREKIDCVLGDTNFWCFGKKPYFLFKKDKITYGFLINKFNDATKNINRTVKSFMNFDKIFLLKDMQFKNPTCIQNNEKYMDHFPVFVDLVMPESKMD